MKLAVKAGMILVAVNNEIMEGRWDIVKCKHENFDMNLSMLVIMYCVYVSMHMCKTFIRMYI